MNPPTLETAKCCGSCIWTNKKKRMTPEDHAPHYTVAKTERWCEKFSIPTVREAVCSDFELEPIRGGAAAVKRALKQNRRLAAILELKARLEKEKKIIWKGYKFAISADDRVVYSWLGYDTSSWHKMDCKESRFDKFLGV
jgi:hypothetical protein